MVLKQGRLADAVAAHQAHAAPVRHVEIHVPERVALAVELIQPGDLEHASLSEVDFDRPSGRSAPRPWTPSASTLPFVKHGDRLRRDAAHEVHVVLDHHDGVLAGERRSSSAVRSTSWCVMPATGSSTSSTRGSCSQEHADLEPLLLPVRQQTRPVGGLVRKPIVFRAPRRCGPCCSPLQPREQAAARRPCSSRSASSRFSNTVCPETPSAAGTSGRCRAPRSRTSEQAREIRASPTRKTLPVSGRVLPVMTSISVVLPAPFGPMTQRSSPSSRIERQIVEGLEAVERRR